MSLEPLIQEFLERHLRGERNASAHTLRNYGVDLRQFADFAGAETAIEAIDHIRIRQFLAHLYSQGAGKATVARRLAALRSWFRYLVREGRLQDNPARLVSAPKLPRLLPEIPSAEQVNRLLDDPPAEGIAFPARDLAILEMLYGAGVRVSELVQLNLPDLDLGGQMVRVRGKGRKERLTPFGGKALAALDAYWPERQKLLAAAAARPAHADPEAVFLNCHGRRLTARSVGRMVKLWARIAGLPSNLHPHSFRHAFASHLLGEGADLRAIQEMLGHKSLSTTQKYTQTSLRQLMEVYDKAHPKA